MGPVIEHTVNHRDKSVIILAEVGTNWWIILREEGAGSGLG